MNDDMNGATDENEELNPEEQQDEQVGKDNNGAPKSPSGIRGLKGKAKTKITTKLIQGTKVVFKIIAAMPLPVKIALLLVLIVFIIFIILEMEDETDKTAKSAVNEVNSYVSSSDSNLTDEQKEYYEENASLIKFPLSVINEIYNNFNTSDNYTSKIKAGFNYVLGTRLMAASTAATTGESSITSGNGTWDQGGLENVRMEVPGEEKNFRVKFYTDLPTSEDQSTRLTSTGSALQFGMIASNSLDIGTKVLLEGHGVFTVNDSGLEGLGNSDNEIAIFVPQKADESSDDYRIRVEGYNEQTIKGKVITVDDYSEYIYSNAQATSTNMHNGINVYNDNGTVNDEKIVELQKSLESQYNLISAGTNLAGSKATASSADKNRVKDNNAQNVGQDYFKGVGNGGYSILGSRVYQCVWWARGRAATYFAFYGTKYKTWNTGWGGANGGEFIDNYSRYFNYGSTPKPNSLAVYKKSGGYGHVAYVEAVDNINEYYYISHAGSGTSWFGIQKVKFGGRPWSSYAPVGFLYLDEPK